MSPTLNPDSNSSTVAGKPVIGILALQGDVALHAQALETLGITTLAVKSPAQLRALDGLVIPGGESTALLQLCEPIGMLPAITLFARTGGAVFGTCAGAILLAAKVTNPVQESLGLINITIRRNGYGRQINSMETTGRAQLPLGTQKIPMTFIRAPRIAATGKQVKVLASYQGEPVLVRQDTVIVATFHPELQADTAVYEYWLEQAGYSQK